MASFLDRHQVDLEVEAHAGNGRLVSFLYEHGRVLQKQYSDEKVLLQVRLPASRVHSIAEMGGTVTDKK